MAGLHGIKETKEAGLAVIALAVVLLAKLKDGAQLSDAVEITKLIASDDEIKAKLSAAVEGIKLVPAEVTDIGLADGLELAQALVPALLEALKTV